MLKFFTVDNFEKEGMYLRSMAQKGWHFKAYKNFKYIFEKGESKDVYYQIDYHSQAEGDKDEYIQFFEDSGWSFAFSYPIFDGEWIYFKKESDAAGTAEIYTDTSSKINLFQKIRKRWCLFGIFISIFMIMALFINGLALESPSISLYVIMILALFVIILYSKMIVNLTRKIRQLQT